MNRPTGIAGLVRKPYYWQRPAQMLHRRRVQDAGNGLVIARTPWAAILCWPDHIGQAIIRTGIHEPVVTETLFRLIGRGEGFVDVGANIGYTSLVGAAATGPLGTVLAIEPHPGIYEVLSRNATCWGRSTRLAEVRCLQAAATDTGGGVGNLVEPEDFVANRGTASLGSEGGVSVPTVSLDDLTLAATVVKIDVEGHEAEVLRGAMRTILDANGPVRDVLFEALDAAAAVAALSAAGFEVFGLSQGVLRPKLVHWSQPQVHWEAPMMLATRDTPRAQRLLGALGWRSLTRHLPRPR